MIRIRVKDYCQDCPNFKAKQNGPEKSYDMDGEVYITSDTIIMCEYANICHQAIELFKNYGN